LREVRGVEAEAVAEELNDDVVARGIVVHVHKWRIVAALD
jgi:hypothetical protein